MHANVRSAEYKWVFSGLRILPCDWLTPRAKAAFQRIIAWSADHLDQTRAHGALAGEMRMESDDLFHRIELEPQLDSGAGGPHHVCPSRRPGVLAGQDLGHQSILLGQTGAVAKT